ncbi:MAG: zinc-ribbon domain-containing protein [Clostridiales bacterium]|nr:zinc-ribbon domain-containing protein [Clostridiales bacterium]
MFCTSCGHELGPNDKFCPACGTANDAFAQVGSAQADIPSVAAASIAADAKVVEQNVQAVQEPVASQPVVQPITQPISQPSTQPVYQQTQPAYTSAGVGAQGERSKSKSITAVILSGVGLFFSFFFYTGLIALVCGLIGLIMSIGAKKNDTSALPKVAFGLGIAASIIGFIEVIIGFIVIVATIISNM